MTRALPGPWSYQDNSDRYTHIVRGLNNHFICQMPQDTSGVAEDTARLIAAAPELLTSLTEMRDIAAACFRVMSLYDGLVDEVLAQLPPGFEQRSEGFGVRADRAIKKAQGNWIPTPATETPEQDSSKTKDGEPS